MQDPLLKAVAGGSKDAAGKGDAAAGKGSGGGGAPPGDQCKVIIDCKGDEARRTEILDAIDNGHGE